jgi:hypothetical protein
MARLVPDSVPSDSAAARARRAIAGPSSKKTRTRRRGPRARPPLSLASRRRPRTRWRRGPGAARRPAGHASSRGAACPSRACTASKRPRARSRRARRSGGAGLPRGRGAGGEGLPRQPGSPQAGRARPRTPGVLAEVVLPLQPAQPRQRQPARLDAGTQTAAHQPVLTGQRADRGTRRGAGPAAAVRGGTHRSPHERPALVDPGLRGDRPRASTPQRTPGRRSARVRPSPAR